MYIILELTSKKMLPKTSPNYLHYKIHKCWLLSWIHVIVIICVPTFECFKMQMVVNLAQVSLSNRKENFYTCPRLTFLKKNATENAYKSISEPLDFKIFWGGIPPDPPSGSCLRHSKLASSCSEVWLRPCTFIFVLLVQILLCHLIKVLFSDVCNAPSLHFSFQRDLDLFKYFVLTSNFVKIN